MATTSFHVRGVFFKIWSYRTKFVSQQNDKLKQVGPLVIATQVRVVKKPKATAPSGLGIGIAFVVVLGVLWFLLMRTEKRDKAYVRAKLRNSLE